MNYYEKQIKQFKNLVVSKDLEKVSFENQIKKSKNLIISERIKDNSQSNIDFKMLDELNRKIAFFEKEFKDLNEKYKELYLKAKSSKWNDDKLNSEKKENDKIQEKEEDLPTRRRAKVVCKPPQKAQAKPNNAKIDKKKLEPNQK